MFTHQDPFYGLSWTAVIPQGNLGIMTITPQRLGRPARSRPIYMDVVNEFRARMAQGLWPEGMILPPLRTLATEWGVGLKVIQLAVDVLKTDGRLALTAKRRLIIQAKGGAEYSPAQTVLEVLPNRLDLRQRSGYFRDLQLGIEAGVSRMGAPLTICHDAQFQKALPKGFLHLAPRGIVVTGSIRPTLVAQYAKLSVPVVLADQDATGYGVHSISVDNVGVGCFVTQRLIAAGHRRIACIRQVLSHYGNVDPDARARQAGFEKAMREASLAAGRKAVFNVVENLRSQPSIPRLLRTRPRFTAVFATSDGIGAEVLRGARELGIAVPQELSIAAIGSLRASLPEISSACVNFYEMGKMSVLMLQEPRRPPQHRKESWQWVGGKSLAPPAK